MEISVKNLQKRIPLSPQKISRTTKKILLHEGVKKARLSIVFVTDQRIKSLNKKYLKKDHPTDVLAFDFRAAGSLKIPLKKKEVDGEIIISTAAAVRHAKMYQTDPYREIVLYVVHGILHLLGYDDHAKDDIQRMHGKEQEILQAIGV